MFVDHYLHVCLLLLLFSSRIGSEIVQNGFLASFERDTPLLLIQTNDSLYLYRHEDRNCTNDRLLYYKINGQFHYVSYSVVHNYLAYVVAPDTLCISSLFKSQWNEFYSQRPAAECHSIPGFDHMAISHSRQILYGIRDSTLYLTSLINSFCVNQTQHKFTGVIDMHATHFDSGKDFLLVCLDQVIHVFNPTGRPVRKIWIAGSKKDKFSHFVSVTSNAIDEMFYAVQEDSEFTIYRLDRELQRKKFFSDNSEFNRIDTVHRALIAIRVHRDIVEYRYILDSKVQVCKSVPETKGLMVIHTAGSRHHWDICKEDPALCSHLNSLHSCNAYMDFRLNKSLALNETDLYRQGEPKIVLTILMMIVVFFLYVLHSYSVKNNKYT